MNRAFPPETIEPCDNCDHDVKLVVDVFGGLEAADPRDYVYAPAGGDINDRVIVCAGCKATVGMDDETDV